MPPLGSGLWRNFRVYQVYGANTDVGKTIVSTLLCRAERVRRPRGKVWYLKPVSTGEVGDADVGHLERHATNIMTQNFYQFDDPISPHLAARSKIATIPDTTLLHKLTTKIHTNALLGPGLMLVETAGGPNSPGPSGTLQADLYRPLRLPSIYVADWHLGGISTSISGFESLRIRGYDVEGVAVFKEDYYRNWEFLREWFGERGVPVLVVEMPPERGKGVGEDLVIMEKYYDDCVEGEGSDGEENGVVEFTRTLQDRHTARIEGLEGMADQAYKHIWWPFTQHQSLLPKSLTTIDSAYGDYFQIYKKSATTEPLPAIEETAPTKTPPTSLLQPTLDGSASWWTQGLGHANHALTLAAAHAAGRYGHVMFAEAIHAPALSLATSLLRLTSNPRLNRVFYSDNGSTGMEVAVKMALKAACVRYGWDSSSDGGPEIEILGLRGSYHGDTQGAMDLSEPSVYNDRIPWYKGRGFWFECPGVKCREGRWVVERLGSVDEEMGGESVFASLQEVFARKRDDSEEKLVYERYIRKTLKGLTKDGGRRFGALVMEPVVLGAGGMVLVDPLFQRTLTNVIRNSASLFSPVISSKPTTAQTWTGLPILADEVFTGLYRLGHSASSSLLNIHPDISVHAKLLTGGLVPLCATMASESIFEAFLDEEKKEALLHGHSYTAHPVGCAVADESLRLLEERDSSGAWKGFESDWAGTSSILMGSVMQKVKQTVIGTTKQEEEPKIWSVWSKGFVTQLSHATDRVDGVWALGSVLAITLKDEAGGGYTSNAARGLQRKLLEGGVDGIVSDGGFEGGEEGRWNVHSRVLGNVLYLMASQVSEMEDIRRWEGRVKGALMV